MIKDISIIRKEIYDFAKDYESFRNKSFLIACFKLTCAAEYCFLNIMLSLKNPLNAMYAGTCQDNVRGAYREALKQAYRFCDKETETNDDKLQIDGTELNKTIGELNNFIDFNQVRNLFEQYDLGRYNIVVNSEKEITFERNKAKRSIDAELYTRWMDKRKPELEERQLLEGIEMELYTHLVNPNNCQFWDVNNRSFSTAKHLKYIYKLALKKIEIDSEEYGDYDFGIFTTEQFKKIYAVLVAISVTNINYHFVLKMINGLEIDKYKPIVNFKLKELIDLIKQITKLKEETISAVINKLSYDAEFHKNKITIFQPLFVTQEIVFFSPSLVYFGLAYGKLLYVLKHDRNYETLFSKMARDREKTMTDDLCDFIEEESELLYSQNYTVRDGVKALAEFDLILYDEQAKKMLLCELKWFSEIEGEYDMPKIERKINDAIGNRLKKEKIAKEYLGDIKKALDIVEDEGIEIQSCIISKNNSGSDFLEDDLPVLDVFWFKNLLRNIEFDLEQLFKMFKEKNYLPDMGEIGVEFIKREAEYAGYKINMESVAV